MKVTLTLNSGSFYFLKNIHLVRNVPTEVDLTTLDKVELEGLKLNIKGGIILTDKDFSDFKVESPKETVETVSIKEQISIADEPVVSLAEVEAQKQEAIEIEEAPIMTPDLEAKEEEYKELTNKVLKEKLIELGVEPESNRKEDLVAQLVKATSK